MVCPICDGVITSNQGAIECSGCLTWIHRRCTKLSNVEFDNVFAIYRKHNSHQWKCINCKQSEVKGFSAPSSSDYNAGGRLSSLVKQEYEDYFTDDSTDDILSSDYGQQIIERKEDDKMHVTAVQYKLAGGRSSSLAIHEEYEDNLTDRGQQINLPSSVMVPTAILGIDDIKKERDDNEDLIRMSPILALLVKQNDKIAKLEKEIEELKQKLMNTKPVTDTPKSSSQLPIDTISELQERTERSKNIIIPNTEGSKSADSNERKEHYDKMQVTSVPYKLLCPNKDHPTAYCLDVGQEQMARHDTLKSSSQFPIDTISELQERTERSFILNIGESKLADLNERKEDNKMHVTAVQYKRLMTRREKKRRFYCRTLKLLK